MRPEFVLPARYTDDGVVWLADYWHQPCHWASILHSDLISVRVDRWLWRLKIQGVQGPSPVGTADHRAAVHHLEGLLEKHEGSLSVFVPLNPFWRIRIKGQRKNFNSYPAAARASGDLYLDDETKLSEKLLESDLYKRGLLGK